MKRAFLAVGVLIALALPGAAAAQPAYAPLDEPGVPLDVSRVKLRNALNCENSVRDASVEPVLLNPATGVTPAMNYSWNWEPALDALGIPWCTYKAPHNSLEDIQVSGEYLVYAIRKVHRISGQRIAVMGHSQGGMSMRWALRFWPDTRSMVDDIIGFAGSNHGSTASLIPSGGNKMPPAVWQQGAESNFIAALNSRAETFAGISYTNIYTHTDEVVTPNDDDTGSSSLHTGDGEITNVATQDVCPRDFYEHLSIGTFDPVAYSLAVDALTNRGPADLSRIPDSVCSETFMPGIDPASANTYIQILAAQPGLLGVDLPGFNLVGASEVSSEPPLACYVFARCPGQRVARK